ncbi:hypothetical protein M413DRAFT_32668 [Hebeloma cylindrosporum]|uniref:Uncharacterized protein n=1 Tax=Hebeloma cylindrosporum TaxID=76867 RepID=A0A0C2Y287_HEBCY|nr:hypothetical protein M413DRAFT_32668 [Hebeloma cylindrosporum h7]
MLFFRMQEAGEAQERIDILVSRARVALHVWKAFRRRDERLYKYFAKHLEAETRLAARVLGYSHLIGWNIEYSQFYADLCVAFHFGQDKDKRSVHLGAFDLQTSYKNPSRSLEVYVNPWWIIQIDKPFGDDQWSRAVSVYRKQTTSTFTWRYSRFYDILKRATLTLNTLVGELSLGHDMDIFALALEETELRVEALEVFFFLEASLSTAITLETGTKAQAVVFMLASRARAALRANPKTQDWSRSMKEEIWNSLEMIGQFWLAGWRFNIPRFYRWVALEGDKSRRKTSPDLHPTEVTKELSSYSNAWWVTGGQKLAGVEEILSLDCSKARN